MKQKRAASPEGRVRDLVLCYRAIGWRTKCKYFWKVTQKCIHMSWSIDDRRWCEGDTLLKKTLGLERALSPRIFAERSQYKVHKVHFASGSCDDTRLRHQHSPSPRELEICTWATLTWATYPKTPLAAEGVVGVGVVPKDGTAQVGRSYQT